MLWETDAAWRNFVDHFQKQYESVVDRERHYGAFSSSRAFIEAHNAEHAAGRSIFTLGLNKFADLTEDDRGRYFAPMMGSFEANENGGPGKVALVGDSRFDDSVDWSTPLNPLGRSVVTRVKDQLQCGACWAFTATESTESSVALNTGILESLSVQELIDCDTAWDKGCVGGNPVFAYAYIARNGLASETSYSYLGTSEKCRERESVSRITGFSVLRPNDEALMKLWVARTPVAVGVEGTSRSFLLYTGGIYDDESCGSTLDHALLVVGFGTSPRGVDYWLCKNSWGTAWGEQGYIRIRRSTGRREGICGIAKAPTFAVGGYGGNASDPGLAAPSFFRLPTLPARSWVEVGLFTASAICALLLAVLEMKQCLRGHRRREREMYVEIPASLATADVEKVPIQIPREGRTQDSQAAQYGAAGP